MSLRASGTRALNVLAANPRNVYNRQNSVKRRAARQRGGVVIEAPDDVLEFRGISKRFGGTLAVDNVDLALEPATVLALLGENGAGKSTLIKLLAEVHRPDAGEIRFP